jgi:hypothetical protein
MNFKYDLIVKLLIIFFGYILLYNIFNNREGLQSGTNGGDSCCIKTEQDIQQFKKITEDMKPLIRNLQITVRQNTQKLNNLKQPPYKTIQDTQKKIQEMQKKIMKKIKASQSHINAMKQQSG